VKLTSYPRTVRQLEITDAAAATRPPSSSPTTPDHHQGAHRALCPPHDHRAAARGDHPGILRRRASSAVNLNVDLDVVLCVLAQALTAAFRLRLPGNYAHTTPDTLQRRFLDTPGEITCDGTSINRRAHSPVLHHARLPDGTIVPW
jgi:hypothetical protein